jgi:ferredoxin
MAMAIGLQCNSCGACVSICPDQAIQTPRRRFWIDSLLCTECLLFSCEPQCQKACPQGAVSHAQTDQSQRAIHPLLLKKNRRKEVKNERQMHICRRFPGSFAAA